MSVTKRKHKERHPHGNPLELLVIVVLVLVAFFYFIAAMSSGDWAWFMPNDDFNDQPVRIELHHEGELTVINPGDPHYSELTEALNEQLREPVAQWMVGLRDETVQEAFAKATTLVFTYAKPIRIHMEYKIGTPNTLLVPVTGSYSTEQYVYVGVDGVYGSGAIIVADLSQLRQIAQDALAP